MVSYQLLELLLATMFLLTTYFATIHATLRNTKQLVRTIPQGTLLGTSLKTHHGRNIDSFLGIPYAQPPIGNLRFANPVPAGSWKGILNATVQQSMCPQISIDTGMLVGDEDCLYINVYSPQPPRDRNSSCLPVMVFIHGGAFQGNYPGPSGPEYLLDADIVLVTFHYRVAALGFLSTGDEVASGNWGQKDQVLVLKWVQDNIRYFGGDPDQVTIFGESTGAGSVHLLTLSKTTIGLFHRYITQSGSALGKWAQRPRRAYSKRAFELGKYVGCDNDTSESLINCLRAVKSSDIINTTAKFHVWENLPEVVWGPTDEPDIEGAFMTDTPSNLFAAGEFRDLPWMNGAVRNEGLLYISSFYSDEKKLSDFLQNIDTLLPLLLYWTYEPHSGAAWINATKSYYLQDYRTASKDEILKNLTELVSDVYFFYPVHTGLRQQNAFAVNPQYFYSFDYRGTFSFSYTFGGGTANLGVCHADDLIYLFPKQSEFVALNKNMSEKDYEMVDAMVQLWTSFAINGKPTASHLGDTTWEPYSAEADNYLKLGRDSEVVFDVQNGFFRERMQFWDKVYGGWPTRDNSDQPTSSKKFVSSSSSCRLKIRSVSSTIQVAHRFDL